MTAAAGMRGKNLPHSRINYFCNKQARGKVFTHKARAFVCSKKEARAFDNGQCFRYIKDVGSVT
jgi:hypothetical protein